MYSYEFKKEVIKYVLEVDSSLYHAQKKFNVNRESIRMWLEKYKNFGNSGLKKQKENRKYSGKFKVDVVEYMHKHNCSLKKTCLNFLIPSTTMIKEWDLIYNIEGREALLKGNHMKSYLKRKQHKDVKSKSKNELIEEVEKLRMENAYLKKLQSLVQTRTKPNNGKK